MINGKSVIDDKLRKHLEDKMPDYYVFVIPASEYEEESLIQAFYEKDFTEIQYQELKDLLMGELKTNTNEQQ
jgi:hypothetical protein